MSSDVAVAAVFYFGGAPAVNVAAALATQSAAAATATAAAAGRGVLDDQGTRNARVASAARAAAVFW